MGRLGSAPLTGCACVTELRSLPRRGQGLLFCGIGRLLAPPTRHALSTGLNNHFFDWSWARDVAGCAGMHRSQRACAAFIVLALGCGGGGETLGSISAAIADAASDAVIPEA